MPQSFGLAGLSRPHHHRSIRWLIGVALGGFLLISSATFANTVAASAARPEPSAACPAPAHVAPAVSFGSPGWRTCFSGTITQSSPVVANWNGETIVAVGDETGEVHLLDGATGQELPGWPVAMQAPPGKHGAIESSPTIAFLEGPQRPPTIIVGSGSTWVKNTVGEVEAFSFSGKERWVFSVGSAAGTAVGVVASPAVGDVTGAGLNVVFGSWDHHIYVLNSAGQQVGFAYDNADTIWSTAALVHVPGQHVDDVVVGSDASGRVYENASGAHQCRGGFLADYRWSSAAKDPDTLKIGPGLNRQWFACLTQSVWSSPAIGMINSSGRLAAVVGTSFFEQPFPADTNKLWAFYIDNGQPVPGWPVSTPGPALGSPAIGVIDSSGRASVVDTSFVCSGATNTSCLSTNRSQVSAWRGNGKLLWSDQLIGPTDFSSPVLVPLRGYSPNDVLVGSPNGLYPIEGGNGNFLYGTNATNPNAAINPACRVFSSPAVIDVVGVGAGTGWHAFESCGGPPAFNFPGEVASYALPVAPPITPGWPMFHASANHVGVARP